MANTNLIKARKLIALAVCPGAGIEESRTAALAAVRLIDQNKLLDTVPVRSVQAEVHQPKAPQKRTSRKRGPSKPETSKGPAPPRSPAELQQVAWRKAEKIVMFLRDIASSGEFPGFTVENLADKVLRSLEVHTSNADDFRKYLSVALAKKAKDGDLNETLRGTVLVYSLGDMWRTF
jgi:hypothetical protein